MMESTNVSDDIIFRKF